MKKISKSLLTCLILLVSSLCLLFAACTETNNSVEFSFQTNGGAAIESITAQVGDDVTLPTPSAREGFTFDGWYADSAFTGSPVTHVVAEESRTFYAKWTEMPAIQLELNGGTLSAGTKLYLKAGENVYDFMQKYSPTKSGVEFGGWFLNGTELPAGTLMSSAGMTLTAEYKITYTVELYLQNEDLNGYEKAAENRTGTAYIGKSFTPDEIVRGFEKVTVDGSSVETLTISENASENVFKVYYNRRTLTLILDPNFPEGSGASAESRRSTFLYGHEEELPSDLYSIEGYCFAGWSTERDGDVLYASDFITDLLYNGTGSSSESTKVVFDDDTYLYAIWMKGYTDLFGGGDYIYLFDEASTDIYLCRGEIYFKGVYDPSRKEFRFDHQTSGKELIAGRLLENGLYVYYDSARETTSATLYRVGVGLDESTHIYLDGFNGITYSVTEEGTTQTRDAKGTYIIDENGLYVVTFDNSGNNTDLNGQTIVIVFGTYTGEDGVARSAFQVRNETEYNWGTLLRFAINGSSLVYYREGYYSIELDGFGNALYTVESNQTTYRYSIEGDIMTLINSNGQAAGTLYIMNFNGTLGYMLYDEAHDLTYTADGGATLKLDGVYRAVYTSGSTTLEGVYSVSSSIMGGEVVTFTYADPQTSEDKVKVFYTRAITTEGSIEGETETSYTFEERYEGYAEYYYNTSESVYYTPLIVLNETGVGKATVYGIRIENNARVFVPVLYGSYTYDSATDKYVFTKDSIATEIEGILTDPIDVATVDKIVFSVAIKTQTSLFGVSYLNVSYWHSYKTTDSEEDITTETTVYNGENGATLTLISGFAILEMGSERIVGTLSTQGGITVLTPVPQVGGTTATGRYLELNEENHSFVILTGIIGTISMIQTDGTASQNHTLTFDGKGNVTYSIITPATEEGAEPTTKTYEGTFETASDLSLFGDEYYVFKEKNGTKTFKFIILSTSSATYFTIYNDTVNGTYNADGGATLELDGFGYQARYRDANGEVYEGIYYIPEENVVYMSATQDGRVVATFYFDLKTNKTFTVRGSEYGQYLLIDNQGFGGYYLSMDGYGKLEVFTFEEGEDGTAQRKDIDTNASYAYDGENRLKLTYKDNSKDVTAYGTFGYMQSGGNLYRAFLIEHEEVVTNYVNETDWSVLSLDAYGTAIKYNTKGMREVGSYIIVSEHLLYYVNMEGTDACVYLYDAAKGTATPITFTPRGYYTENLDALLFSQYGFMIYNGETRYYYYIADNDDVMIYHQDPTDSRANRYGFVEENFGKFQTEITFEGKKYIANSGYAITFNRKDDSKENYPLSFRDAEGNVTKHPLERLVFTPTGAAEFSVTGQVQINGQNYACTVNRVVNDDETTSLYVVIQNMFFFDITVTYSGETGNLYEVTSFQQIRTLYSNQYLSMYYIYAMMVGYQLPNTYGIIQLVWDYSEEGEAEEPVLNAAFGGSSGVVDINGDLIPAIMDFKFSQSDDGLYWVEFKLSDLKTEEEEPEAPEEGEESDTPPLLAESEDEEGEEPKKKEDTYTYRLYFVPTTNRYMGIAAYDLYAFVRVQEFDVEVEGEGETKETYKIELERVIATDYQISVGAFLTLNLSKKGEGEETETIDWEVSYTREGKLVLVSRVREETEEGSQGKIKSSKFYVLTVENDVEENVETSSVVPAVKSISMEIWDVETIYSADGKSFIDVATISETAEDGTKTEKKVVLLFAIDDSGTIYIASECTYDEGTTTYSFSSGTRKFTAKVTEEGESKTVVITETTPAPEEE